MTRFFSSIVAKPMQCVQYLYIIAGQSAYKNTLIRWVKHATELNFDSLTPINAAKVRHLKLLLDKNNTPTEDQ